MRKNSTCISCHFWIDAFQHILSEIFLFCGPNIWPHCPLLLFPIYKADRGGGGGFPIKVISSFAKGFPQKKRRRRRSHSSSLFASLSCFPPLGATPLLYAKGWNTPHCYPTNHSVSVGLFCTVFVSFFVTFLGTKNGSKNAMVFFYFLKIPFLSLTRKKRHLFVVFCFLSVKK